MELVKFGLVAFIGISIISISKDDYTTINVLGVFIILLASFSESLYFTFQKKYIENMVHRFHTIYNNGKLTIYAYFYS